MLAHTCLQDIDEKANALADSAKTFQKTAGAAKRLMRCRYWKMILLFTVLVAVILTIIIVPLVKKVRRCCTWAWLGRRTARGAR